MQARARNHEIARCKANLAAERNSSVLYRGLAQLERNPRQAALLSRLAETEEQHAEIWVERLVALGVVPARVRVRWRVRLLLYLARWIDPAVALPRAAALERLEADGYLEQLETEELTQGERRNAELLAHLGHDEFGEFLKKLILKGRRYGILVLGLSLFGASLWLARNVQLEGFFLGLFGGVLVGPVLHYLIAKILVPLPFGRIWCGWACWTGALLDQLPYRQSAGWLRGPWPRLRYLHFGLCLGVAAGLVFGLGWSGGVLGRTAALWFALGNVLYWTAGVTLALLTKDNRAFCKYLCPVSVILKVTARPALLKVAGVAEACRSCPSKACTSHCPMDIQIPEYILAGQRVLSTECILCQYCVSICPPNTLTLSFGLDVSRSDRIEVRAGV
ncbi:MAG: 4Fe-4S binding protein [Trueperaceae bacterium]|nr:MAG: 4Fe-4S binding protein [Trueperaceae bacterium]